MQFLLQLVGGYVYLLLEKITVSWKLVVEWDFYNTEYKFLLNFMEKVH